MASPAPSPIFLFGRIICPRPSESPALPSFGSSSVNCDRNEASERKPSCVTVDGAATTASAFPSACDDGNFQSGKRVRCPRCESSDTKFCYFNNYNVKQPRHFCRNCQRYWTAGGSLRNVPVGAGRRRSKNCSKPGSEEPTEGGNATGCTARSSYVPSSSSPSSSSCEVSHVSTSKKANCKLLQETNTMETQRKASTTSSGVLEAISSSSKVSLQIPSSLGVPVLWPWPWPSQAFHGGVFPWTWPSQTLHGGVLPWPYQATSLPWPHSSHMPMPMSSSSMNNPNTTTNLGKRPLEPSQQHPKSLKVLHQPQPTPLFSAFQPNNAKDSVFQPKSQLEIKKEH